MIFFQENVTREWFVLREQSQTENIRRYFKK